MRDIPAAELYERDFVAWTRQQAAALRRLTISRPNAPLDLVHLIEEVADLGKSERDTVRSHVRTIIEHCLKLQHARVVDLRAGWMSTIDRARTELEEKLSPSLRGDLRTALPRLYGQARRNVARDLARFGESEAATGLPEPNPFTLGQLLHDGWYPEAV